MKKINKIAIFYNYYRKYYLFQKNAMIEAVNFEFPSVDFNFSGAKNILLKGDEDEIIYDNDTKNLAENIGSLVINYKKILDKTIISKKNIDNYFIKKVWQRYINQLC